MYFKYNTLDEVIKNLEDYRLDTIAKIEAWKQVIIKKKKNGEEFARLSQSLENAKTQYYYPTEDAFHPYLTVIYTDRCHTKTDHLAIFYYVDDLSPEDCANRYLCPTPSYLRQTSPYTVDEIRGAIQTYIASLEVHKEYLEKQIEVAPILFEKYRKAIKQAEKELEDADKELRKADIYPTSLFYAITSTK